MDTNTEKPTSRPEESLLSKSSKRGGVKPLAVLLIIALAVLVFRNTVFKPQHAFGMYEVMTREFATGITERVPDGAAVVIVARDDTSFRRTPYTKKQVEQLTGLLTKSGLSILDTAWVDDKSTSTAEIEASSFLSVHEAYPDADAIISVSGIPDDSELEKITSLPALFCITDSIDDGEKAIEMGLVDFMICRRVPSDGDPYNYKTPSTAREWFDECYKILTPAK